MANPYLQRRAPGYQGGPQKAPVRKKPQWGGPQDGRPNPAGGGRPIQKAQGPNTRMTPQQRQQRMQASTDRHMYTFGFPAQQAQQAYDRLMASGNVEGANQWLPFLQPNLAAKYAEWAAGGGGGGGGRWGGPEDGRPNPGGGGGGIPGGGGPGWVGPGGTGSGNPPGGGAGGGGAGGGAPGTPTLPLDPVFEAQRRLFEDQLAAQLGMLAPLRAQIEAQTNMQGQRLNTNETVDKARLLESLASRGALRGGIQRQDEGYLGTDYLRQRQDLANDAAQQYGGIATQEGQARLDYMQMLTEALIEAAQRAQADPYAAVGQQGMGDAGYNGVAELIANQPPPGATSGGLNKGGRPTQPPGGRPGPVRGGGWKPSWQPTWQPQRRKAGR